MSESEYVRAIQDLYLRLPNAAARFNRSDRCLASTLYCRGIPIQTVQDALLLATSRRVWRNPDAAPLPPVRSLHYFMHTIDEVLRQPLPRTYVQYLEYKIAQLQ